MSLLLVAYPELNRDDYDWIQAIRIQHDSHISLIEPHVTLVFPTHITDSATFIDHVRAAAQSWSRFTVAIRCAVVVKDAFSPKSHLFLVPDEGYSMLVKLHDALYCGVLAPELSFESAYIPHLTIGDHLDPHTLKHTADAINKQNRCIFGHMTTLDVLQYEHGAIQTIQTIPLQ